MNMAATSGVIAVADVTLLAPVAGRQQQSFVKGFHYNLSKYLTDALLKEKLFCEKNLVLLLAVVANTNVLYLYSVFQVIVDHSKCFYFTGFALTHSHTHGYLAGTHLLIRRVNHSRTHTLMAQHQEEFWGSLFCSRTLGHVVSTTGLMDRTRNLLITTRPLYHLSYSC